MSAVLEFDHDGIAGAPVLKDKPAIPSLADLIHTCAHSASPQVREWAARALYIQGAADALDGKRPAKRIDEVTL